MINDSGIYGPFPPPSLRKTEKKRGLTLLSTQERARTTPISRQSAYRTKEVAMQRDETPQSTNPLQVDDAEDNQLEENRGEEQPTSSQCNPQ